MSCTVTAPHDHVIQWTQAFARKSARDGIILTQNNPPKHFAPTYSLSDKEKSLTFSHSSINYETSSYSGIICPHKGQAFSRYAGHASPDITTAISAFLSTDRQTFVEIASTLMEQANKRADEGSCSMKKLIESAKAKSQSETAMKFSENDPDRTPQGESNENIFEKFIDLTMTDD